MIHRITITGVHTGVDQPTKKYVNKKIGRLSRYLPRHARKTVSAEVLLKEVNRAHGNKYEAEVVMKLPGKTLAAKDSTVNILAAIDIVEAKLAAQLHRYQAVTKSKTGPHALLAKLKRGYVKKITS